MEPDKRKMFEEKQKMKNNIAQASYMIDGLKYHFSNIQELYFKFESSGHKYLIDSEDITRAIKHEVVAYLNRLGQFYFFAKSQRVKDIFSNPLSELGFINKIIVFRMKQTAHRASDAPKNDDKHYDIEALDSRFSYGTVTSNNTIIFDIYSSKEKEQIIFDPLEEHDKIMSEINSFMEKLNSNIFEEDEEILKSDLCKWLINQLYVVMFFAEGENHLKALLSSCGYEEQKLLEVISHLTQIDWIFQHTEQRFLLKHKMISEIESRNLIDLKTKQLVSENRKRVLKAIYNSEEQELSNFSCKLICTNQRENECCSLLGGDLGNFDFLVFYKEDLKNYGFLTKDYKLTERGRIKILQLKEERTN